METYLAPDPIQSTQFIPGGNVPANGGQLFFYANGTNTKQNTYKDAAGTVLHTNPIVLDSGGNIPSGGSVWFISGDTYTVVFAPFNDTDPPASPYWTRDNLTGMNDPLSGGGAQTANEWVVGPTPTFISATSFSLTSDQTGVFQVGRRLQSTNTGGTIYSTILTSVFGGGITTITVKNDSSVLDSGLSAVNYGFLSSVNESIPAVKSDSFLIIDSSDLTKTVQFDTSGLNSSTNAVVTMYSGGVIPSGVIWPYGGTNAPVSWVMCDGTAYGNTSLPNLYAAIGTNFGSTDAFHFLVPNMSRSVPVGVGGASTVILNNVVGSVGGEEGHVQTSSELARHNHFGNIGHVEQAGSSNGVNNDIMAGPNGSFWQPHTELAGSSAAMNIMQPSVVVSYIIKT